MKDERPRAAFTENLGETVRGLLHLGRLHLNAAAAAAPFSERRAALLAQAIAAFELADRIALELRTLLAPLTPSDCAADEEIHRALARLRASAAAMIRS